mgnify:CR=1 FL=1
MGKSAAAQAWSDAGRPHGEGAARAASVSQRGFHVEVDELLLARARRGDRTALEAIFRLFAEPAYALARRLCGSEADAEDVLQEAMFEVLRSIRRFRGEGSFAGWVRRITVSKALMKLRSNQRFAASEELPDVPCQAAVGAHEATLARLDLEAALAALPPVSRAVVWLHEVEGFSHDEIAAAMGKSRSFSKSQLARAHARLRALVAGERGALCT